MMHGYGRTAKAYFYNPVTKDTSWKRPPPKPPPPPPIPKPKMEKVKAPTGLIPGTKDPEDGCQDVRVMVIDGL